jgi:Fanconi anemia group M protein
MLVKELKLRLYQQELLDKASKKSSLIVLPTGLGKTFIALGLSIIKHDLGKVVFMAPTRPLVEQHKKLFDEYTKFRTVTATGLVPPGKREKLYAKHDVVFCTPQTLENDVLSRRIDLRSVSLLVFDEAHRAVGDYAYVFIAQQYQRINPEGHVLAMTASPGRDAERISDVCTNLRVERVHVKSGDSASVLPYVKQKRITPVIVELPPSMKLIKRDFERVKGFMLESLKKHGLVSSARRVSKKDLLELQKHLMAIASSGEADFTIYSRIKEASAAFKALHALELLETKGVEPLRDYLKKLKREELRVKSSALLFRNVYFRNAYERAMETCEEHPKIRALKRIIRKEDLSKSRVIVFTQLRGVSKGLTKLLNKQKGVRAAEFIGQKEGVTQKKQLETLERFKEGEINVLVATQVIHEGIHVSDADVGVFFEPLPSAIQTIQRKGRIGRTRIGRIYVLMTKGCIDEKYYWASKRNEDKLRRNLEELSSTREQTRIVEF